MHGHSEPERAAITGAIVAGGRGERFGGRPKGLETVAGVKILDRVAGALREVVPKVVLICNQPDANRWLSGVPVYHDERSERGSLVGLHTAIRHAPGPVLVVAWDMPFVTPELFALIVGELGPEVNAVVPEGPRGLYHISSVGSSARVTMTRAMQSSTNMWQRTTTM